MIVGGETGAPIMRRLTRTLDSAFRVPHSSLGAGGGGGGGGRGAYGVLLSI